MKVHLKRTPIFQLNAARVLNTLAAAALAISAALLSSAPVRAQTGGLPAMQCQVAPNGVAIACNGTIPGGSVGLNCQVSAITNNSGVYSIAGGTCSITSGLGPLNIAETINGAAITIDSNSGLIYVHDTDAASVTVNGGLASVTATTAGGPFFLNLSQPSLTLVNGTIKLGVNVLGINVAQVTGQGSGALISVAASPSPTLSISAANISGTASVLGILTVNLPCGSPGSIDLSQILIRLPLTTCNAS